MKFETAEIDLDFEVFSLKMNLITDLDGLISDFLEKSEDHPDRVDERIPYWADLWASALALSEFLIESGLITAQKTVLEIGCGVGLPSLVAAKLGAKVYATDYLPEAVAFAHDNAARNGLKLKTGVLDWRYASTDQAADVLLASDVAYEARAFEPLLTAFRTLCRKNGHIIVSEPNRYISKLFFDNLKNQGFDVKHSVKKMYWRDHLHTINIYVLQIKNT